MNTRTRTGVAMVVVTLLAHTSQTAHADSYSRIDADDNRAVMQEVADALADVEYLFDTGPLTATTAWMPAGMYAAARGRSIVVNKIWSTGTYDALADAIESDVASGYHNGGCTPIRTIALHEAGHVIDNLRGNLPRARAARVVGSRPRPDLRGVLSGYSFSASGAVDAAEALAEAFQAVMCGSDDPAERELYEMLVN